METNGNHTKTILLLQTSNACYHILNLFINELAKALRSFHQPVEILDITTENQPLEKFIGGVAK